MAVFQYLSDKDLSLQTIWAWTKKLVQDLNKFSQTGDVPAGAAALWSTSVAPDGWLLAQGQALSMASYPALFVVYGYVYGGAGDIFNMPDYSATLPGINIIVKF